LKMEKSEAAMDALNVERSIGKAFAPLLRMLFRNARAVQSSGSVRTTPIFTAFVFWFGLCILGFNPLVIIISSENCNHIGYFAIHGGKSSYFKHLDLAVWHSQIVENAFIIAFFESKLMYFIPSSNPKRTPSSTIGIIFTALIATPIS